MSWEAQYPTCLWQLGSAHFKYLLCTQSVFFFSIFFHQCNFLDVINWPFMQLRIKVFLKRNWLCSRINHPPRKRLSGLRWFELDTKCLEDRFMNKYIMILTHVFNLLPIMSHQSFVTEPAPHSQIPSPFMSIWPQTETEKLGSYFSLMPGTTCSYRTLRVTIDRCLNHAANGPLSSLCFHENTCRHIIAALINTHSWIRPSSRVCHASFYVQMQVLHIYHMKAFQISL